jgi:hypothetical protein
LSSESFPERRCAANPFSQCAFVFRKSFGASLRGKLKSACYVAFELPKLFSSGAARQIPFPNAQRLGLNDPVLARAPRPERAAAEIYGAR